MKYNLTFIVRDVFPWFWQNITNNAFVDVIMNTCFDTTNQEVSNKEIDATEKAGYSIQRYSLERALNDKFDNELRRIIVSNSAADSTDFIYNESETILTNQQIFVYNEGEPGEDEYFFNTNEIPLGSNTGFTVQAPSSLQIIESELRSWIERVQMTGTLYTLIFV